MSKNKEKEKELEAEEKEAPAEEVEEESTAETDPKDKEIASLKDQLMRNMAEYDNYRKRTARERTELTPEITARIVGEFLPVLDNLERALQAETADEKYKEGVKLIYDSFMGTMDKLGVEKVQTEDFDPAVHQAVQQVESDLESGKIVSVFQNGYKIGTKVLRFAMVTVAQ